MLYVDEVERRHASRKRENSMLGSATCSRSACHSIVPSMPMNASVLATESTPVSAEAKEVALRAPEPICTAKGGRLMALRGRR